MTDDGAAPQWVKQINDTTYSVVIANSIFESFFLSETTVDITDYSREEIEEMLCPSYYESLERNHPVLSSKSLA